MENVIGQFLNTVPVRVETTPTTTVAELLRRVEDFRLVVSEACAHLLDPAGQATSLTLRITLHGRDAEVLATADVGAPSNGEVLETLAREVVSALADEVSFQRVDGKPAVRFTKRPTQQAPTNADDQG